LFGFPDEKNADGPYGRGTFVDLDFSFWPLVPSAPNQPTPVSRRMTLKTKTRDWGGDFYSLWQGSFDGNRLPLDTLVTICRRKMERNTTQAVVAFFVWDRSFVKGLNLLLQLQIVDLLHILSTERERFGRNSID